MGTTPAFNVTVEDISEEEAKTLMAKLEENFGFEGDGLEYEYELPDRMDSSGMSASNDTIYMRYGEGTEYEGFYGNGLYVHYSPYYSESVGTLEYKIEILKDVRDTIEESINSNNIDGNTEFTASVCTI